MGAVYLRVLCDSFALFAAKILTAKLAKNNREGCKEMPLKLDAHSEMSPDIS
jgi:hypothetical protein